jgi:hypothetical protein
VFGIRKGVDHGHVGMGGEILDRSLVESPRSDAVYIPAQDAGDIGRRFPLPEPNFWRGQINTVATKVLHGYMEGNASSE